ncbi:WecB/TagA/CpsF family glycosyltransferase [Mycobacterium sp. CBMA247]|nr:WecB/TagA/CpsF family glycosyltransferase [Mycolicibacterium sp. CBMA 329]MUL87503.1 WecB/TagA/CpsF family glycosyltransferase [Mycolicibacterium sp. CBMA 331]MUM26729.1 WecB/TagA/CpsF family glycosyltransferase [Mycolicibacterium sp. CBMA 295]MUM37800.1 WecB/TagA/CpsF family glycosyltransferase [Mycolicibacterium sp. CBMA 247]MUM43568.1 WecB/TagA/CpsF family glycosyltransferase [Mycolicibacterium sp. CBMA 294]
MRIGSTPVTRYSADEVVALVTQRIAAPGAPQLAIGSVNLDHLHHFRAGRAELGGGTEWLWVADGAPVAWRGSRLAGISWPRVTGADLLEPLLDVCVQQCAQVGFLGGLPDTHQRLAEVWARRYPTAAPALFWSPSRSEVECPRRSAELAAQVRAAGVRVLIVGLGKPRQEVWIDRHAVSTGAEVVLAFGAAADFLAGAVNRAPAGYQRYGLEWLYRLRQEPRRLARRYLVQGPRAFLRLRHAVLEDGQRDGFTPLAPGRQGWRP